jgi:hypothetical protein
VLAETLGMVGFKVCGLNEMMRNKTKKINKYIKLLNKHMKEKRNCMYMLMK